MRLTLPWNKYEGEGITNFFTDLAQGVEALPGVRAAASGSQFAPISFIRQQFTLPGQEIEDEGTYGKNGECQMNLTNCTKKAQACILGAEQLAEEYNRSKIRLLIGAGTRLETLVCRQQIARADFAATFTRFAAPASQKEYRGLSASQGKQ